MLQRAQIYLERNRHFRAFSAFKSVHLCHIDRWMNDSFWVYRLTVYGSFKLLTGFAFGMRNDHHIKSPFTSLVYACEYYNFAQMFNFMDTALLTVHIQDLNLVLHHIQTDTFTCTCTHEGIFVLRKYQRVNEIEKINDFCCCCGSFGGYTLSYALVWFNQTCCVYT